MRQTFAGWLLRYCQETIGSSTKSLKKMRILVESDAPQAAEMVFVYAIEQGKSFGLLRHVEDEDVARNWTFVQALLEEWLASRDAEDAGQSADSDAGPEPSNPKRQSRKQAPPHIAEEFLRQNYDMLPTRYRKVLDLYDSIEAERENDLVVKAEMAQRVLQALEKSGRTRYQLCHDLGLNEGNVYAWLAGDPTKVSRETARKAWHYAEGFSVAVSE